MKLTDIQKRRIEEDLAAFTNEYAGNSKEERKAKGQFFTPASLVIEMLEMFEGEEPGDHCPPLLPDSITDSKERHPEVLYPFRSRDV